MGWPARPNSFFQAAIYRLIEDRLIARLKAAGLENAFANVPWKDFVEPLSAGGYCDYASGEPQCQSQHYGMASKDVVSTMAKRIKKVIAKVPFKGHRPSGMEIEALLRTNLKDEIEMQRERISRIEADLGKGSIQYQSYEFDVPNRLGMVAINNAKDFYQNFLGLKSLSETDKIAIGMETDNQFLNTALAIVFADRGIDLHDYNTNLRQVSLSFHDSFTLANALEFMGIKDPVRIRAQ